MAEETAAEVLAEVKDIESKLEQLAEAEKSPAADSGAASEATKPAEDSSGQAPAEASAPAPEAPKDETPKAPEPAEEAPARPEFKDSVGNVFDADGAFIRREDGFGGTGRA